MASHTKGLKQIFKKYFGFSGKNANALKQRSEKVEMHQWHRDRHVLFKQFNVLYKTVGDLCEQSVLEQCPSDGTSLDTLLPCVVNLTRKWQEYIKPIHVMNA